jgi:hypothetical protein
VVAVLVILGSEAAIPGASSRRARPSPRPRHRKHRRRLMERAVAQLPIAELAAPAAAALGAAA